MLKGDGFRLINDRFIDWNKLYDFFFFFAYVCVCAFEKKKNLLQSCEDFGQLLECNMCLKKCWESFCLSDETQGRSVA